MKIKKAIALLAGLAVLSGWGAVTCSFSAEKVAGIVVFVKGKVEVKRNNTKEFLALNLNDLLYAGDAIKTAEDSRASVVMKGGAEVRLNQNSTFEISKKGKVREILDLTVGQLWTRMLHKMARLNVKTPAAVCAVRGTEADVEQRNLMTVKVYEGTVDVQNNMGKQTLTAGQMTSVAGANAAPEAPKKMSSADAGTWQNEINVQDMEKFINKLSDASGDKSLKLKIKKQNGTTKDVEIKMKKKQ